MGVLSTAPFSAPLDEMHMTQNWGEATVMLFHMVSNSPVCRDRASPPCVPMDAAVQSEMTAPQRNTPKCQLRHCMLPGHECKCGTSQNFILFKMSESHSHWMAG